MQNAVVTERSQVSVLNARLAEARITHDADARINVSNVRVAGNVAYFCEVGEIDLVKGHHRLGDGQPLPMLAQVTGLPAMRRDEFSYMDLLNVRVRTNGRVHIIVDRKTELVPVWGAVKNFS